MRDEELTRRLQVAARRMEAGAEVCVPALLREAAERLDGLRRGIEAYLSGDYPHPRDHRPGKCQHGTYYWEECAECDIEHFTRVLAGEGGGFLQENGSKGPPSSTERG